MRAVRRGFFKSTSYGGQAETSDVCVSETEERSDHGCCFSTWCEIVHFSSTRFNFNSRPQRPPRSGGGAVRRGEDEHGWASTTGQAAVEFHVQEHDEPHCFVQFVLAIA